MNGSMPRGDVASRQASMHPAQAMHSRCAPFRISIPTGQTSVHRSHRRHSGRAGSYATESVSRSARTFCSMAYGQTVLQNNLPKTTVTPRMSATRKSVPSRTRWNSSIGTTAPRKWSESVGRSNRTALRPGVRFAVLQVRGQRRPVAPLEVFTVAFGAFPRVEDLPFRHGFFVPLVRVLAHLPCPRGRLPPVRPPFLFERLVLRPAAEFGCVGRDVIHPERDQPEQQDEETAGNLVVGLHLPDRLLPPRLPPP